MLGPNGIRYRGVPLYSKGVNAWERLGQTSRSDIATLNSSDDFLYCVLKLELLPYYTVVSW